MPVPRDEPSPVLLSGPREGFWSDLESLPSAGDGEGPAAAAQDRRGPWCCCWDGFRFGKVGPW